MDTSPPLTPGTTKHYYWLVMFNHLCVDVKMKLAHTRNNSLQEIIENKKN